MCSMEVILLLLFFDSSSKVKSFMWIVFLCPTGQITLSEFMEGARKDEWVMNLLKLDVNATGWVIQNYGKLPWFLTSWVHPPTGLLFEADTEVLSLLSCVSTSSSLWLGASSRLPWFWLLVQRSESCMVVCYGTELTSLSKERWCAARLLKSVIVYLHSSLHVFYSMFDSIVMTIYKYISSILVSADGW